MGREDLEAWQEEIAGNPVEGDLFLQEIYKKYVPHLYDELVAFGGRVVQEVIPLVADNHRRLPTLQHYDGIGNWDQRIIHDPSYWAAGDVIYGSKLMEKMNKPGGLKEGLAFMLLSSYAGEAGHNCPIACSAGILRVFQKVEDFPGKQEMINKLIAPSYGENWTGAQFVTEVQGGSDVGANTCRAVKEKGEWRIYGEKWFCSNIDAELFLMTARFDPDTEGTKGLGLFLVPSNNFYIRRLKEKIGTKTLASAECDFQGAYAIPMGKPEEGFKLLMENVLHTSRLCNTICTIGMARRAIGIAKAYAKHRKAFGRPIGEYPLVSESLDQMEQENNSLLAAIFDTLSLQDSFDLGEKPDAGLLLRLLANLNKYLSAKKAVEHIHHSLDVLAGNGCIETFSEIPKLMGDSFVTENWEGTHNTLRMQTLRDILKYKIDEPFLAYVGKDPELERELARLKSSTPEEQSLLIRSVVDKMGALYLNGISII